MEIARINQLLGDELAQNDQNFTLYAIKRDDLMGRLIDPAQRYIIINAPRGSGKSGLLLKLEEHLMLASATQNVVVKKYLLDGLPAGRADGLEQWMHVWRRQLLIWLVEEIGTRIEIPQEQWQLIAVELAERSGRRGDRFAPQDTPADDIPIAMLELIVARSDLTFHLLLDEMDDHFVDEPGVRDRLAALLQACKAILRIAKIYVRLTIRPHIMTLLQTRYDHVQQLRSMEMGLTWKASQLKEILARRIVHFNQATDTEQFSLQYEDDDPTDGGINPVIKRYFDDFDMSFEKASSSRYRAFHTLSLGRPRWMLEFCALALEQSKNDRARSPEYKKAMHIFGSNRMKFLAGEHYFHAPRLEGFMNDLASRRQVRFNGATSLRKAIEETILGLTPVTKRPVGDPVMEESLSIARLLYMVEFIRGRQGGKKLRDYRFITYAERPSLTASWSVEPTIVWEIHPTFCLALNLVDNQTFRAGETIKIFGEREEEDP